MIIVGDNMNKRYLTVLMFLAILVGCFFLFFDKPTNKEIYDKYLNMIASEREYDDLSSNNELNINVENQYINEQYHYVVSFTPNTTLNNFKAFVVVDEKEKEVYYPSFGIVDNHNINLVDEKNADNEAEGINLVVNNKEKIEKLKIYVSYNNYEYFYLMNMEE